MTQTVRYESNGKVGFVIINSPPVNALSQTVRAGLRECFRQAASDISVGAVVLLCEGRTFVAGADLQELGGHVGEPAYHLTYGEIEAMEKPVIAAMHGTALGGGLELTLACHYRLALRGTRLGFPEINLGIVPGAGGTQRLPRLIGVQAALRLILSGQPVDAESALELGLIDSIGDGNLRQFAQDFAENLLQAGKGPRRVGKIVLETSPELAQFFDTERQRLQREMPGRVAPQMDVDAVEAATRLSLEPGLQREKVISDASLDTSESRGMRRLFFAERQTANVPGITGQSAGQIRSGGIVGAGTMGRGIAMAFANSGIPVILLDLDQSAVDRAISAIAGEYEKRVKRGRMSADEARAHMELIQPATDYASLSEADLVIEAVFEKLSLKREIFSRLDDVCKPGAILASNTSTLDVSEIASATKRPEDVVGLHFFSPAHVMRLLEVVRTEQTRPEVIAASLKLAGTLRKVGVLSGNRYGFIGNRMMDPYGREAERMLLEGVTPAQIDSALEHFGMAMGILAVFDMAGVDVGVRVREERKPFLPDDPGFYRASALLVEQGMLGQKSGAGYYRYEPGSRQRLENSAALDMFAREGSRLGIKPRKVSDEEIVERCVYALINEGFQVLKEGVALRAADVDVVYTAGYGFPRHRGGPMFFADTVGADTICRRLDAFAAEFGPLHWQVSPLLRDCARNGTAIADFSNILVTPF